MARWTDVHRAIIFRMSRFTTTNVTTSTGDTGAILQGPVVWGLFRIWPQASEIWEVQILA